MPLTASGSYTAEGEFLTGEGCGADTCHVCLPPLQVARMSNEKDTDLQVIGVPVRGPLICLARLCL